MSDVKKKSYNGELVDVSQQQKEGYERLRNLI